MDQADFAAGGSRDVFESFSCLSSLFAAVDFFLSAAAREICFFSTCTLSLFPISFEMDGGTRKRQSIRPSVQSIPKIRSLRRSFFFALLK